MASTPSQSGSLNWNIDSMHSSIDFSVRHMGIFTVRGSLGSVSGSVVTVDETLSALSLSIDVSGISTNNDQRDGHLKSADFLNVAEFPTIEFKSTGSSKTGEGEYSLTGDLTIVGQTHPVTVTLEVVPPVKDPWGNTRAGATGSGSLSRQKWGITYNSVMETGGVLLSDEVKFTFDIQAVAA